MISETPAMSTTSTRGHWSASYIELIKTVPRNRLIQACTPQISSKLIFVSRFACLMPKLFNQDSKTANCITATAYFIDKLHIKAHRCQLYVFHPVSPTAPPIVIQRSRAWCAHSHMRHIPIRNRNHLHWISSEMLERQRNAQRT